MHREPWIPSDEELAAALDVMRPVVTAFARRDAGRLAEWSAAGGGRHTRPAPCRRRRSLLAIRV
ncbi:MAG TPA: hypothetical protein VFK42_14325 [Acidimicrobiales bacterium]|jgi:hypothetical protein|nr:hypothetical protein [Acidimicrobiales bacterium]